MSRSIHSVKLTPYHSSQLNGLSYSLGDVVFDQDNLTLRVMDGENFGGQTLATQSYINAVFSQAIITVGNSTNATTSYPSGAFRIAGGASINKDLTVIGNLNATLATQLQPNITSLGTLTGLTSSGVVNITNNTAASSLGSGAFQVSGGASIAGNLYVGGNLVLAGQDLTIDSVTFKNGLTLSGNTTAATEFFTITNGALTPVTKFQVDTSSGNTTIAGTLGVTGDTTLTGALTISNSTVSTTTATGALKVTGGVGIGGNVNVGGTLGVTGDTTLTGALTSNGNISVVGGSNTIGIAGVVTISNSTVSTTTATGALKVTGGVGIGGNVNVGGTLRVGGINIKSFSIAMAVALA